MTAVGRPNNGQDEGLYGQHVCGAPVCGDPYCSSPARWITTPGDDRQHRSSNDCPCTPIVWPGGAVEHR